MRQTIFIIVCCIFCQLASSNNKTNTRIDSLLRLLPAQKEAQTRFGIYRNLADISFDTPEERTYLKQMYQEAKEISNQEKLLSALGELTYAYIKADMADSVTYYINLIKKITPSDNTKIWLTYLHIRQFNKELVEENSDSIIERELQKRRNTQNEKKDIYSEIEQSYLIGYALFCQNKNKESIPYLQTALKLADTLPAKEGYGLQRLIIGLLANIYTRVHNPQKAVSLNEKILNMHTTYYDQIKKERPFYNINTYYIQTYASILTNMRALSPENIPIYLQKIISLSNGSDDPFDKYNCFYALNNYYLQIRNLPKALASIDSLIKYAPLLAPENLPGLYNLNARIYEAMGDYKNAFATLQKSYVMNDSINASRSKEQLAKLQIEYNVDKLNYEKSQLEIKNKRILVISLSIILFISIGISIYLYKTLKKEQQTKAIFKVLKTKAEESENMKTAFVNSICHEIRTPLNSIVGFSDLIFDDSIDEELRMTFPEEIQKNTLQLTNLINSMLEVSNLNVSDEKLPCEPTNINAICIQEIDHLKQYIKPGISCQLDIPEKETIISSNGRYLSLVIEHLLNNANKFTEAGTIMLHMHIESNQNQLQIKVTDTGCGIPVDKQEEVFERFTKLDTYKPGNGLGLYLCQLIINRLAGKISIDPDYTKGVSIIIDLPIY